jgi:hypothetical protein
MPVVVARVVVHVQVHNESSQPLDPGEGRKGAEGVGVAHVQAETAGVAPQGLQQGDARRGLALLDVLESHRHAQSGETLQPRLPEGSRGPHPARHALWAAEVERAAQVQDQVLRPKTAAERQGVPHPPAGGLQDQVVPARVAQVQERAVQVPAAVRVPPDQGPIEGGPRPPFPGGAYAGEAEALQFQLETPGRRGQGLGGLGIHAHRVTHFWIVAEARPRGQKRAAAAGGAWRRLAAVGGGSRRLAAARGGWRAS